MTGSLSPNDRQVGGNHYAGEYQHWDFVRDTKLDYLLGNATKYIARCRRKHSGMRQDLAKSSHYIEKFIDNLRFSSGNSEFDDEDKTDRLAFCRIFAENNSLTIAEETCITLLILASMSPPDEAGLIAGLALRRVNSLEKLSDLTPRTPEDDAEVD